MKIAIQNLSHSDKAVRLEAIHQLADGIQSGRLPRPKQTPHVNNHIHTTYSFSPYSPSAVVWAAYQSGLRTAGIMDHDTLAGAREFIRAGKDIGIATTIGFECRVDLAGTPLEGRRVNNPDQLSNAYVALHGIPHSKIDDVGRFTAPLIAARNRRNALMQERINGLFSPHGISLDFQKEILPLSMSADGGAVTERHLLFGLSKKMIAKLGRGSEIPDLLKSHFGCAMDAKTESQLRDPANAYYDYDLMHFLKKEFVKSFYLDATGECPKIADLVDFSDRMGAIFAYSYLGDVKESVTGDKKAQTFEDSFLDELFVLLNDLGIRAITYMPSRNAPAQIARLQTLCDKYGMLQISGEDINSPRQSFRCEALLNYPHLIDATWALIGHEMLATENADNGFFSTKTINACPRLNERIEIFKRHATAHSIRKAEK